MVHTSRLARWLATAVLVLGALVAHAANPNKSVIIGDGETVDGASSVNGSVRLGNSTTANGSVSTVNGSVKVGTNAAILDANTVNGSVTIGDGTRTEDLSTVNGAIRLGMTVSVDGEITAVNGDISSKAGSTVSRSVGNVNGSITLAGSEVGSNVSTVVGDITLEDQTTVQGDLIVEKPQRNNRGDKPTIIIGPGSRVVGTVVVEHPVNLFISESANVGGVSGVMSLDDAVRFSGSRP